jgi:hypothetical protein
VTRRKVIGGVGVGLAAMAINPAIASKEKATIEIPDGQELQDPTTKYPNPPFNGQSQPWPGLAGKMDPNPDHGEKVIKVPAG